MRDVKDLNFYKIKAKELPRKKFDELAAKAEVKNSDYWVQVLNVATLLQQEDKARMEAKAQSLAFVPPKNVSQYLFNDLNFVLWAMPQDNPIPQPIYNKMMKLKELQAKNLPITPNDELTAEESKSLLSAITWKRGDDKFGIKMIGSIESGLPFGQDRLLLIWAITEALKKGEPKVIGFYIKDFLDYFGIDTKGRAYDEVEERCERLKGTNIKVWWTTPKGKFQLECNYLDSVLIFRPKKAKAKGDDIDSKEKQNTITLHLGLWAHLTKENYVWLHPDVIRTLKDSPGALDLYQWSCGYAFKNKIKTIPLKELFGHLGMKEEQLYKHKKGSIKKWVEQVNDAVSDKQVFGAGTHFTLDLQEDKNKRGDDLLFLHPSVDQLSDLAEK